MSALRAVEQEFGASSSTATAIRAELYKASATANQGVFFPERPPNANAAWFETQKAPLQIGALKALAMPFYRHLNALNRNWVEGQLHENGFATRRIDYFQNQEGAFIPWNPANDRDTEKNRAVATIGQLKAVFSLRFETLSAAIDPASADSDRDGVSDQDEVTIHHTDPSRGDTDGDGLSDLWEISQGLDPNDATHDNGAMGDPDGDGSDNGAEQAAGTGAHSAAEFPPQLLIASRGWRESWNSGGSAQGSRSIRSSCSWQGGESLYAGTGAFPGPAAVEQALAVRYPFPEHPPGAAPAATLSSRQISQEASGSYARVPATSAEIQFVQARVWLRVPLSATLHQDRTFRFVLIKHRETVPLDGTGWPTGPAVASVPEATVKELTVAKGTSLSAAIDLSAGVVGAAGGFSEVSFETMVLADLVPDWNRDGAIDNSDRGRISKTNPWRYWINDDADSGDLGGSDLPIYATFIGPSPMNCRNPTVDGTRDLIDFFPLMLEFQALLGVLPPSQLQYRLKQRSFSTPSIPAIEPLGVVWLPDADPTAGTGRDRIDGYLRDSARAHDIVANRQVVPITNQGVPIPAAMLEALEIGKGLLLCEGRAPTTDPLVVEVLNQEGTRILELPVPLSISRVEDMFRHKNLRGDAPQVEPQKESSYPPANDRLGAPPNLPDSSTNGDWVLFLHGYNVNGEAARSWHSEAFKRLFWSGSNARFVGVSWYGDETQRMELLALGKSFTPKYYENIDNALNTSQTLANFVNGLGGGRRFLASHSLGGMVVSDAIATHGANVERAFLFDPAVGTEDYLSRGSLRNDTSMEPLVWRSYPETIKSSEWYRLFPENDSRSKLTWRGRFQAAVPKISIFYSAGEEVLTALPIKILPDPAEAVPDPTGSYAFPLQAMLKGMLGGEPDSSQINFGGKLGSLLVHSFGGFSPASPCAGWCPPMGPSSLYPTLYESYNTQVPDTSEYVFRPPSWFDVQLSQAAFLYRLKIDPPFKQQLPPGCTGLYDPLTGPTIASQVILERRMMAQMIPDRTLAAGGAGGSGMPSQSVLSLPQKMALEEAGAIDVYDMQANRNGWPDGRPMTFGNGWRHGDIKDVAYLYVYRSWMKMVEKGELNRDPNPQ